jgi:preprotein translocase subunit SecE
MFGKIKNFFLGSYEELQKVSWPSRKQVINHTLIVVITILVAMAIVAALDYVLFTALKYAIYQ